MGRHGKGKRRALLLLLLLHLCSIAGKMKFGKYLALRQLELPEYSGHFIDYKALKKLIKQLAVQLSTELLQENKASFFFRVERELDKVNLFYLEKQANLAINLDLLMVKKSELLSKLEFGKLESDSTSLRNSISYLNLYQNFKKIHQDLIRLQQFIELNETGFSKVVKKWDKRSKLHTKELFILSAVSVQPVFHKNEINELSDLVTQCLFDLESIVDGDFLLIRSERRTGSVTAITGSVNESKTRSGSIPGLTDSSEVFMTGSVSTVTVPRLRNSSVVDVNDGEIDDLYSSFVNVATIKDPELTFLAQWVEKVKGGKSNSLVVKFKFSKVFLLSIANLKISDTFLESFLNLIKFNIDLSFNSDDLNNNKNILHECCSIPSTQDELNNASHLHVVINNGVKVVNLTDSINHSRSFIVSYLMNNSSPEAREKLLIANAFNGRTCLHYASQYNRLDLLDLILPYFPRDHLDDLDNESMSALLLAIKHNNFDVVAKLIESGSNCFPQTTDGKLQYLPINYACKFGNYQILEYILSQNKSPYLINQQDVEGLFPLHVIARSGHFSLIKLLIEYGAQVNQIDGLNKWTPLFYSALEGNVKTTQELVKFGAKLDMVDDDGFTVLYYCVIEGHIKVLNELLSYDDITTTEMVKETGTEGKTADLTMPVNNGPPSTEKNLLNVNNLNPNSIDSAMATVDHSMTREDESEDEDKLESSNQDKPKNNDSTDDFNAIDSIPDLQLPPPVLPLRRYGHNFLEQKVLIELIFPLDQDFIKLFNSVADLKPGRLTLTSNISDIVPRNILLPMTEDTKANNNCIFQTETDSLDEFRIDFEIFPKFGTRLIAKTTALSFSHIDTSSPEINSVQLPLFDFRLRNIGELKFNYQVIFPFAGTLLETSKFDTYWKTSTSFVKNRQVLKLNAAGGLSPNNFLPSNINNTMSGVNSSNGSNGSVGSNEAAMSVTFTSSAVASTNELISSAAPSSIVTATSLSGEYLRIRVCLLNDGTPVVCPFWSIALTDKIDLYIPNLSLEQLHSITSDLFDYNKVIQDLSKMTAKDFPLIKKLLKIIYLPLDLLLEVLNDDINLNLEIIFPSQYELDNLPIVGNVQQNLNFFIDLTLNNVFNHIRAQKLKNGGPGRSIIFLSSNSLICKILNWKQPNFPVFLNMNGITYNSNKKIFESRTTNGLLMEELDPEGISENSNNKQENQNSGSKLQTHEMNNVLKDTQEVTIRSVKEAVNFTINNNLIGLITSVHLLNLVPKLVPLIRSRGLVLVASSDTYNNQDQEEINGKGLDAYTKTDINGLRFNDVLSFKEDVAM